MTFREPRPDLAFTLLRVVVGLVYLAHGWQKFFVMGISGTTGFFTQIGAPFPALAAPAVATLELVGGAALVLGLLTRPVALLLMLDVMGAIVLFHRGFFVPKGVEFVMTLAAAAGALALGGGGAWSVDRARAARAASRG